MPQGTAGKEKTGEVRTLERDIRFLKTSLAARPVSAPAHFQARFWILQLFPAVFMFSGLAFHRFRVLKRMDPARTRTRRALGAARAGLKSAERMLKKSRDGAGICARAQETLARYLADRWNVSPSGLTLGQIESRLKASGAEDSTVARLRELWEQADLARYTPDAGADDPASLLKLTRALLAELERLT